MHARRRRHLWIPIAYSQRGSWIRAREELRCCGSGWGEIDARDRPFRAREPSAIATRWVRRASSKAVDAYFVGTLPLEFVAVCRVSLWPEENTGVRWRRSESVVHVVDMNSNAMAVAEFDGSTHGAASGRSAQGRALSRSVRRVFDQLTAGAIPRMVKKDSLSSRPASERSICSRSSRFPEAHDRPHKL